MTRAILLNGHRNVSLNVPCESVTRESGRETACGVLTDGAWRSRTVIESDQCIAERPVGRKRTRVEPSSVEPLSGPEHPTLRELHAYWLAKRGQHAAPPKSAINPGDLKSLLSHIGLVDVVGTPPRFHIRLFGTSLASAYGEDITGKNRDDLDLSGASQQIRVFLERAVLECQPQSFRAQYTKATGRYLKYEQINLPLSDDGTVVNRLLVGFAVQHAYGQPELRSHAGTRSIPS